MRYAVQPGDTLSHIAQQFSNTVEELLRLKSEITDPNFIRAGQIIEAPEPYEDDSPGPR